MGVKLDFIEGEASRLLGTNSSQTSFEECLSNFKLCLKERMDILITSLRGPQQESASRTEGRLSNREKRLKRRFCHSSCHICYLQGSTDNCLDQTCSCFQLNFTHTLYSFLTELPSSNFIVLETCSSVYPEVIFHKALLAHIP